MEVALLANVLLKQLKIPALSESEQQNLRCSCHVRTGSILRQIRDSDVLTPDGSTTLDYQEVYHRGLQKPQCLLIDGHRNGAWN